jgi:predicted Zn-dependent peptidase
MKKLIFITIFITGALMADLLPKYYTKTLKNGLEVVAIPMRNGSGVITTDIFYKVGSRNEIMGKSGIAHMLEHLNFKSTKHLKAGEFDEIVKGFGGVNNASTGFDYTQYFITSSSKNLSKSLELFAELMQNLNLKDEEFQPERDVVLEERRWRTDNSPMGYLYFRLFNNLYLYHSYHWTPIGFVEDIKNWTIDDIKNFHKTYYQPKNAVLIVAGDIDKDEVFKEAKDKFEKIENKIEKIPTPHQKEPKQDGQKRIIIHKESQVQMLAIAYHIPNFQSEDQIALTAISDILTNGKSSRLNSKLIDKKRLLNSISAYNMENKDPGVFLFLGVCNPGIKAKDVEKEIEEEIERIKTTPISQKELEKIKINEKADLIYQMENSRNVASIFGSYLARGDITPLLEYEKRFKKLTPKMIQEVAKKYFTKDNQTILILKKDDK